MAHVIFPPAVQEIRGKAGTDVFAKSKTGPILRPRTHPKNPKSPAQNTARAAFGKGSSTYKTLTTAQLAQWSTYALSITKHSPLTGKANNPYPITAFNGLASKFLQINPTGVIPMTHPTLPFLGDTVAVITVGAVGQVTFTASAANAANVKTELLLQPMKTRTRTPTPKGYRTKSFIAFVVGMLSSSIPTAPGYYAPAYRFVNALTGQELAIVTLPVVQVS